MTVIEIATSDTTYFKYRDTSWNVTELYPTENPDVKALKRKPKISGPIH